MSKATRATADALIACCRENRTEEALNTLYADDAVSVEAMAGPNGEPAETVSLEGLRGKHAWWDGAMEMHDFSVEGPFMHGDDRFGVIFEMDVTDKASGQRSQSRELAVYTVNGEGKINREEFFYTM
ncbi:MAG: SnoaL-like domain-containing protein [Pseudomonadota bacterium]